MHAGHCGMTKRTLLGPEAISITKELRVLDERPRTTKHTEPTQISRDALGPSVKWEMANAVQFTQTNNKRVRMVVLMCIQALVWGGRYRDEGMGMSIRGGRAEGGCDVDGQKRWWRAQEDVT
jgi:hypothetical protein